MHACRLNFRLRDSCKDDLATLCPDAAFVAVDSLAGVGLRGAVRAGV